MNAIDALIVVVILVAAGVGYLQGFLRQLILLAILYLATILAVQYHVVVGGWLGYAIASEMAPRASVAFLLVFAWAVLFLGWVAKRVYPTTRIEAFGPVDNLLGGMLGLVSGGALVCVLTTGLRFAISVPWPGYESTRVTLDGLAVSSRLVPTVESYAPLVYAAVTPWFQGGLPAILAL